MAADWKDIPGDSKEKYALYLCSREWAELKRAVHDRAAGKCERCKLNAIDAVHHLTYERKYAELLTDLAGWCAGCHAFTHAKSDDDPAEPESLDFELLMAGALSKCCIQVLRIHNSSSVRINWDLINDGGFLTLSVWDADDHGPPVSVSIEVGRDELLCLAEYITTTFK